MKNEIGVLCDVCMFKIRNYRKLKVIQMLNICEGKCQKSKTLMFLAWPFLRIRRLDSVSEKGL